VHQEVRPNLVTGNISLQASESLKLLVVYISGIQARSIIVLRLPPPLLRAYLACTYFYPNIPGSKLSAIIRQVANLLIPRDIHVGDLHHVYVGKYMFM
jgi:hypothetical protein